MTTDADLLRVLEAVEQHKDTMDQHDALAGIVRVAYGLCDGTIPLLTKRRSGYLFRYELTDAGRERLAELRGAK